MIARFSIFALIGFVILFTSPNSFLVGQPYNEYTGIQECNTLYPLCISSSSNGQYNPTEDSSILSLSIENFDFGSVLVNGLEVTDTESNYFFPNGDTLTLIALPEESFMFLGWEGVSFNDTLEFILEVDRSITAVFGTSCLIPPIINEEVVFSEDCDAYYSQGPVVINSGGKLIIEEGRQILISSGDSVFVHGDLIVNGSNENPVCFRSLDEGSYWGCIRLMDGFLELNYSEFYDYKAVLSSDHGELIVRNCTIPQSPYYFGDIFSIHHSQTTLENNLIFGPEVFGKTDIIDCDQIFMGIIVNNTIYGATDDGIDIGTSSSNVEISGNRIYNCNSMGISIGENSVVDVNYNIVAACEAGIQVHTGAMAYIDHNTLFDNDVAIRCYHYPDEPNSGGHAIVSNTILSSSNLAVFELFPNSSISFAYSLSDTEIIEGTGNLNSDPNFVDTTYLDFELLSDSPCIDSGDPSFPADSDGTRTDMGALFFDQSNSIQEYFQNTKIGCFPNPAVDHICFELMDKSETIQSIEIFDPFGKIILKKGNINSTFIRIENISNLSGLYFGKVQTSQNANYTCRFIISHNR